MLVLGRYPGQSIYVGRLAKVTVAKVEDRVATIVIEAHPGIAVSSAEESVESHLSKQMADERSGRLATKVTTLTCRINQGGRIARHVFFRVVRIRQNTSRLVHIGFEAPRHIAISRDEFTMGQHLKFQQQRELEGV